MLRLIALSRSVRPIHSAIQINKRVFTLSSSQLNEPRKTKLADIKDNIYTLPNALCVARICATPVIGYLVVKEMYVPACGLFVVAGLTDMLDGQIARSFPSQRSLFGTMLDPVADKLLIGTLFVTLSYAQLIPYMLTAVVFARDFLLLFGAFHHRYKTLEPPRTLQRYFNPSISSIEIKPTFTSKLNTVLQLSTVAFSLAAPVLEYTDHPLLQCLWFSTAITTIASGIQYIGGKAIKHVKTIPK
ncbi:Cardiolipin synthase [Aphelenchoides bicaudatus]|nr:Cardiolipin synthase [Aphelenchoides bicaudatus]